MGVGRLKADVPPVWGAGLRIMPILKRARILALDFRKVTFDMDSGKKKLQDFLQVVRLNNLQDDLTMNTPKGPFLPSRFFCIAGMLFACLWASPVFGQSTWTGSANGEWSDSANWNPTGVPGSGSSVLFHSAGGGNTSINLSSSAVTVKNIEFNSASCAAYTIGTPGEQLHLNGPEYGHGAITLDAGVTQDQTFAADLTLNGDGSLNGIYNIVNNSSASLNITGSIAPSGGKSYYLSLMGSGSGINTISGVMNDGATLVEMQVNVTGGTWALTGPNTFGGGVYIGGGTLVANTIGNGGAASSLGNSANTNTNLSFNGNSGTVSTLRYTGATASTDRNFFINTGVSAVFDITGGDLTFTGGAQGGSNGSLIKTGAAMLALNAKSDYSGQTILREGTLSANDLQNGGHDSSIGKSSSAGSNLVFDGGTLQYTGGSTSIDRSFTITTGKVAAFDISDPGTTLTIDSPIPVGPTTGGLTKTGLGTLLLAGFSSYIGPTTVNEGTLRAGLNSVGGGPFGIASETTIMAAGTLDLNDCTVTIGSLTGQAGSRVLLAAGTLTTGSSANATFGGVISGNTGVLSECGGLTKTGAGMQTFTGNNTYPGPTVIQGGGITLAGGSIAASASISISNNATLAVVNYGTGTDAISNTAPVTMSGGTLSFQIATLEHLDFSEAIGNLTVTGGYNTVGNAEAVQGATSTLTITSLARTGSAVVNFSGENLGLGTRNRILFTNAPTLGQWALYNGNNYAAYDATYGIVAAAYATVTRLSSGDKVICSASQGNIRVIDGTGTPGAITLNDATTTIFTLTQNATGGVSTIDTAGKTFALSSALVGIGAGGLTIGMSPNSGNLTSPSGALTLVNNSTNNLTVNSTVVGLIDVKMSGTGTAVLAGNNTYTGVTTLEQGVLSVSTIGNGGVAGNLGAAGNATSNIVFTGGTLLYTGPDTTTDRGFTVTNTGSRFETAANFQFSGAGINFASGSITIGGAGNTTITSIISGSGALAKDGSSTLTLQGMNTFTGGVTISGGSVSVTSIGNGGQAGNLGAASNASANLALDGGSLVYNASGIAGSNRGMTVTANGGTFVNANATATLFLANGSPVSIAPSGVFTVDGPGSTVIGNAIIGAGALRKTGDGQLFLDNPGNSFTGGVTISGGTLGVAAISNGGVAGYLGAATAAASNLVFDGGTLAFDPNTSATLTSNRSFSITAGKTATFDMWNNSSLRLTGSVPATTGGLTKTGNGTLALAGNMAFSGQATVSAGTLLIDGTLGAGTYPSDSVYAAAGATLGGSGTIGRDVYISGTQSPGSNGPGVQTIDGAVVYDNPGATVDWELVASTTAGRGTNYDGINGNGNVANFLKATTLDLIFNAAGSTVKWSDGLWGANQQWVVYSRFNVSGIENFSLGSANWADSTGALFGTALPDSAFSIEHSGQNIVLNYAGVPEPSTYALLALAALALACARLRKKTAR